MYSYLSFLYIFLNTCKEVRVIYTRFCNIVKVIYANQIIHKKILLLTDVNKSKLCLYLLKHLIIELWIFTNYNKTVQKYKTSTITS